jgi:hypothetical protein
MIDDDENVVDSVPRRKQRVEHYSSYAGAAPAAAYVLGVPLTMILVALIAGSDWASKTVLAGLWPYLIGFFALLWVPCFFTVAWHVYKLRKAHKQADEKHTGEIRLLKEQVKLSCQTNQLVQESRLAGDNIEIQYNDNGGLKSVKIIRAAVLVEQARVQQLGRVQQVKQVTSTPVPLLSASSGTTSDEQEDDTAPVLPVAPPFKKMMHLITTARMPLCFCIDPITSQVIPMFGTIDDLLSMAITGKPGRGKTVALMYYVAMLLKSGAEVFVFDPHGAMAELAVLNDRVLPGMPATARIHYYDRKETITGAVPGLYRELEDRDNYYRPQEVNGEWVSRRVKHPLLILADELPILADFDEQVAIEYKKINRQRVRNDEDELEVPSLVYLIRRIVLEARKWRCFFIGSGQSMDAEVLPTKVTENLNSRIVFFSSNRRARMSGLENDAIKNLLPLIRRGGSGVMIYDCARWDEPLIGAIPFVTIDDLLDFLGVDLSEVGASLGIVGDGSTGGFNGSFVSPTKVIEAAKNGLNGASNQRHTGELVNLVNPLVESLGNDPDTSPFGPNDPQFTDEQITEFIKLYKGLKNRKECLRRMRNQRTQSGYGLGNRYDKHARLVIEQYRLDQE